MTRGVYTAATGMLANQTAQDAIAENLANANTTGYKQDIPEFQTFGQTLLRRMGGGASASVGGLGSGVTLRALATDYADGALQKTGNPLDVAMTGDAYLTVQTPQGVRLTRDGAMTRSTQGLLVQANGGNTVLGQNGQPIAIPAKAKDIVIDTKGDVVADGRTVGRLGLAGVSAATGGATKVGDNLYTANALRPVSPGSGVQQGFLETSNVSVVKEMVSMISVMRSYETNQKMLQAEDDVTGKAVNEVAKV